MNFRPKSILEFYGERFKRLGFWNDKRLWALAVNHAMYGADNSYLEMVLQKAELVAQLDPNPCREEPTAEQVAGNIVLGQTYENCVPFCLDTKKPRRRTDYRYLVVLFAGFMAWIFMVREGFSDAGFGAGFATVVSLFGLWLSSRVNWR